MNIVINKQKSSKIKENIYSQAHVNGTNHHFSGSSCDLISPTRRTIMNNKEDL